MTIPSQSVEIFCVQCRTKTASSYIEAVHKEWRPIVEPPYFCAQCTPHDATLVALRNSPRVGVGCYNNTHDEPETEEFSHDN